MKEINIKVLNEIEEEAKKVCRKSGVTLPEILRTCVENLAYGYLEIDSGRIVSNDYRDDTLERLGFGRLLEILKVKKYPDDSIRKMVDQQATQIICMPKFKKSKGD